MTIEDLLNYGNKYIHKDQNKLLLGSILNLNPLELSLYLNKKVLDNDIITYKNAIKMIDSGEPIQYVLNNTNFYGYDYYVNKNVLIPRFETEELVYNTLSYLREFFPQAKVLDLCTGSGCIGLTLKMELSSIDVTLSDISKEALEITDINKNKYKVDCKIVLSDIYENITGKFDCIIANPPYISFDEEVMDIVKNNEPSIALYASNNGLAIYERIFKDALRYLNERYLLALELNSNKKDDIVSLANIYFKDANIIVKKDSNKRDRMLFILKI